MKSIRRFVLCGVLNYHRVEKTGTDGYNEVGRCKDCDRLCLKDSQNNWFLKDGRNTPERIWDFISILLILGIVAFIVKGVK